MRPTPAETAQWVYRHNAQLKERTAISSRLARLMRKERACVTRTREVCALDWDFWTASQDGAVFGAPPRFEESARGASHATVRMAYRFAFHADGRDARPMATIVRLVKEPHQGCWVVDDIVDPEGGSLKATLSASPS